MNYFYIVNTHTCSFKGIINAHYIVFSQVYYLEVFIKEYSWIVTRRYREFYELHEKVVAWLFSVEQMVAFVAVIANCMHYFESDWLRTYS